jgi:phenylalanyl-tRNA synthetase beta chain
VLDIVGTDVPVPLEVDVRPSRVNGLLGTELTAPAIAELLVPLGMEAVPTGGDDDPVRVVVPTFRPDVRPAPMGEADLTEEVARTYGYSRLPRRHPAWPQPGGLTTYQRERRKLKDVLCGIGASEAWTTAFVTESDQVTAGFPPPYIEVTNPLVDAERFLRSSMAPGLVRAIVYNAERRQGDVRLFEVGSVFRLADVPDPEGPPAEVDERLCAVFAGEGDDAWSAVAAWHTVAGSLGLADWVMEQGHHRGNDGRVSHEYRSATLLSGPAVSGGRRVTLGEVGELDPTFVETFGLVGTDGRPRRVGWLDLDLDVLLDPARATRRPLESAPISRFPSSDIDLAFVVPDEVPAGSVEATLVEAGGELLESVQLFDVYRGESLGDGARSLAYRLRFCALDRTLTDEETASLRSGCITAVEQAHRAALR